MESSQSAITAWQQFVAEHSCEQRAAFAASLIPNLRYPIHGVQLPELRRYAKRLARGNWREWLDEMRTDGSLEEVMFRGFLTGYAKMEWAEQRERVEKFVAHIDNWSVCDSCCATFTQFREHRSEGWLFLQPYIHSEQEYEQRFAAVMMLNHYLCDEYIDRVLEALAAIHPTGYYSTMAIGWALATAFAKYPEKTFALLNEGNLLPECRRKACRKILESLRTPQEWRIAIQNLNKREG